MNSLIYIIGYPPITKLQIFNTKLDKKKDIYVNYYLFDGELLETWEVGQLLGGN